MSLRNRYKWSLGIQDLWQQRKGLEKNRKENYCYVTYKLDTNSIKHLLEYIYAYI